MKIEEYLDSEGILHTILSLIESQIKNSLSEDERKRYKNIKESYYKTPWDSKINQDYYTTISELTMNNVPLIVLLTGEFRSEIEQTAPIVLSHIKDDRLILDVGASFGYKTKFYGLNVEGRIIGLDINKAVLNLANQRRKENMAYVRGNMFSLPFRDSLFDSVLFCNTIQEDGVYHCGYYGNSWYDYLNGEKIKELSRVVRPNGRLIVGHKGYDDFPQEVIETMESCGIKVVKSYEVDYKINDEEIKNHVVIGIKN